ncbi:hypothetical protein AACH10_19730 [Ideonella sp. DXS22W]|uniref:General secretion pathway protein GspN n=1 Tax=Pseudaquabacterium inlustre TaxID=2984192 RepID=A0ABU9CL05_9BURK
MSRVASGTSAQTGKASQKAQASQTAAPPRWRLPLLLAGLAATAVAAFWPQADERPRPARRPPPAARAQAALPVSAVAAVAVAASGDGHASESGPRAGEGARRASIAATAGAVDAPQAHDASDAPAMPVPPPVTRLLQPDGRALALFDRATPRQAEVPAAPPLPPPVPVAAASVPAVAVPALRATGVLREPGGPALLLLLEDPAGQARLVAEGEVVQPAWRVRAIDATGAWLQHEDGPARHRLSLPAAP